MHYLSVLDGDRESSDSVLSGRVSHVKKVNCNVFYTDRLFFVTGPIHCTSLLKGYVSDKD